MANQLLARLGIVMGVDSSELEVGLSKAKEQFKGFTKEVQRQSNEAAKMTMAMKMATESYGKSLSEVDKLELELKYGRLAGNKVSEQQIKLLRDQAAAYDAVKVAADKANKAKTGTGGLTAQQSAALGYQTTDIITSLAGGQNPLMVLLQQGGQLRDQFGGFKPLFSGIAEALTPLRLAVGGFSAVVLGLGYAYYKAFEEQKTFQNSLILTGNYAGITESKFNSLSVVISDKYKTTLGETKVAMQAIVSSGQFTSKSLESVGNLIATMSKLTGESAQTVAGNLIPSLDGTASSAKRLNDQYHFLTVQQYRQIDLLSKQGKQQEAIKLTSDALNEKLSQQTRQVGYLEEAWVSLTRTFSSAWQSLKDLGKDATIDKQLAEAARKFSDLQAHPKWANSAVAQKALEEYQKIADKFKAEAAKAEEQSKTAEQNKKKIDRIASGAEAKDREYYRKNAALKAEIEYEEASHGLDKIGQLRLRADMEWGKAIAEYQKDIVENGAQHRLLIEENLRLRFQQIRAKAAREEEDIYRDQKKKYEDKAILEQDSIDKEKERLDVYKQNILATEAEMQIALSRLKLAQEIAEIERDPLLKKREDKDAAENRLREIQKSREGVINQAADLKMLQDINQSVFNNMSNAVENFVKTGKFAFKDLAKSIIQDLIAIDLKAQASSIWKSVGGLSGIASSLFDSTGALGNDVSGASFSATGADVRARRASGGSVSPNTSYLVGENGPEIFTSGSSGSITPNNMIGNSMGGQSITYNGPYIANMSAIDTQSATQFLARNKSAVWAANQTAQRSLPQSR